MLRTRASNPKIKLKKGDLVVVIRGRFKGQKGRITAVHPKLNKVSVDNINMVKRHMKPTQQNTQGGIIEVSRPLWVSKVAILEPQSQKPSRIVWRLNKDGTKERLYQKTKTAIQTRVTSTKVKPQKSTQKNAKEKKAR